MSEASTMTATERPVPDWSTLGFALTETDTMFLARGDTRREEVWAKGRYEPFGDLRLSPATAFLSYGQGIFEGLKAHRAADGRILVFRPDMNARRFQASAERICMPAFPENEFVDAVLEIVRRNERFVPPASFGSLYVRPMEHATEAKLGLGVCNEFLVSIFVSPVGSYFGSGGASPTGVRLRVLDQGRVPPGGTGSAKTMCNYGGAIFIANQWKAQGYDDVLYLDARHVKYVTETSGSNPFIRLRNGTLVTPPLDDQILAGVTRDSTIHIARDQLGLTVEERAIELDEVMADGVEMFCTGTAWTLLPVRQLDHHDRTVTFDTTETRDSLFDILYGIQTGAREDPYNWTRTV